MLCTYIYVQQLMEAEITFASPTYSKQWRCLSSGMGVSSRPPSDKQHHTFIVIVTARAYFAWTGFGGRRLEWPGKSQADRREPHPQRSLLQAAVVPAAGLGVKQLQALSYDPWPRGLVPCMSISRETPCAAPLLKLVEQRTRHPRCMTGSLRFLYYLHF